MGLPLEQNCLSFLEPLMLAPLRRALLRYKYPGRAGYVSSGQGLSQRLQCLWWRCAEGDDPSERQSSQWVVQRMVSSRCGFWVVTYNLSVFVLCCRVGITMPTSPSHCAIICEHNCKMPQTVPFRMPRVLEEFSVWWWDAGHFSDRTAWREFSLYLHKISC